MLIPDYDTMQEIAKFVPQLTIGKSLFVGPVKASDRLKVVDDASVFCFENGATKSLRMKTDIKKWLKRSNVTVVVRSPSETALGSFRTGQYIARLCYQVFDSVTPSGYISCFQKSGAPVYLGQAGDGHHEWRFDIMLGYDYQEYPTYQGNAVDGVRDAAFITSLPVAALRTSRTGAFEVTAAANENIFVAFPSTFASPETPSFQIGALQGGFTKTPESPIMVDVNGVQTAYDLWISDNVGLGLVKVTVL